MSKDIQHKDRKLHAYLEEILSAIRESDAQWVYSRGSDILERLLNNLGRKNKIFESFLGKDLKINECLENKELSAILVSCNISIDDCKLIDNKANSFDSLYDINQIRTYISLLSSIGDKIAKAIYGPETDLIDSFSPILTLLDMQSFTSSIDDDIDYDSLDEGLLDDPVQRLPICFCLDLSGSMRKFNKFERLKEALRIFNEAILHDPKAKDAAEVAVITFNDKCNVMRDFSRLSEPITLSDIVPSNGTMISSAINKALELLDNRKKEYSQAGVEYYQPWLVIISDGLPGDNCNDVKQRVLELEANKKITVFSIPIIPGQLEESKKNLVIQFMDGFSSRKSQPVNPEKISELFRWFSKSASMSVRSNDQYTTQIDLEKDWMP